jgi:hypothetical protein
MRSRSRPATITDQHSDRSFKTKDGHINIASTGRHRERLQRTRRADQNPIMRPVRSSKNRDPLNAEIDSGPHKTSAEWIDVLNKIGVPGPIYAIERCSRTTSSHVGIAQLRTRRREQVFVGQPVKPLRHTKQDRGDAAGYGRRL